MNFTEVCRLYLIASIHFLINFYNNLKFKEKGRADGEVAFAEKSIPNAFVTFDLTLKDSKQTDQFPAEMAEIQVHQEPDFTSAQNKSKVKQKMKNIVYIHIIPHQFLILSVTVGVVLFRNSMFEP